jgi:hypothetical protein
LHKIEGQMVNALYYFPNIVRFFTTFCVVMPLIIVSWCTNGSNLVISGTSTYITCIDVAESFSDGAKLDRSFMHFFIEFIFKEEIIYRPTCIGYRVFLSPNIGVSSSNSLLIKRFCELVYCRRFL